MDPRWIWSVQFNSYIADVSSRCESLKGMSERSELIPCNIYYVHTLNMYRITSLVVKLHKAFIKDRYLSTGWNYFTDGCYMQTKV